MATIFGDVQYTQNGTFNNPCWKPVDFDGFPVQTNPTLTKCKMECEMNVGRLEKKKVQNFRFFPRKSSLVTTNQWNWDMKRVEAVTLQLWQLRADHLKEEDLVTSKRPLTNHLYTSTLW